ncbi:MAG TPA: hypothetical protein VGS19_31160, partial [Streptosporangiaceae bacterium]|nr:hypothetical protein [Streptosporangiaceae bacterium]
MSANVMTPERPAVQSPRAGFVHVLRAEWTKFRTVRGWVVWMVLAAVLIDLVGLFAGGQANIACGNGRTGSACMVSPPIGPGGEAVTDSFYFVHQPLASQGSVTARVTSLTGRYGGKGVQAAGQGPAGMTPGVQPWSKAGIIIKASTTQGSAYAAMLVTGSHGVRFQYDYTQDIAGLPGKISGASPRWLRLTRSGDTVTGYDSADGSHWTEVGAASLPGLPATVQAGLFATSPVYTKITPFFGGDSGQVGPSLTTGAFDSVHLSDGQATGRWAGSDIGPNGPDLTGPPIGFHQAGGRFTVTGSGDIAPLVQGTGAGGPTGTIEDHLAGTFAGLIAVVVIAAAFMTAEYRRGLIRTTLAASPRRGQVLAAKALVLALLAFVAGVVAAVIAVFAGVRMAHSEGI